MNEQKVRETINQLIADQQKRQPTRKQYPASKAQLRALESLGLTPYMPARFGYTDAAVVIEAAEDGGGKSTAVTAWGEGETAHTNASALYKALRETTKVEADAS